MDFLLATSRCGYRWQSTNVVGHFGTRNIQCRIYQLARNFDNANNSDCRLGGRGCRIEACWLHVSRQHVCLFHFKRGLYCLHGLLAHVLQRHDLQLCASESKGTEKYHFNSHSTILWLFTHIWRMGDFDHFRRLYRTGRGRRLGNSRHAVGCLGRRHRAIAEASEVRRAFLLGAGKPMQAKLSAYKSILLAFVVSSILSTIVLFFGNDVSQLTTSEETLHKMVHDLIPLFAMGNIALAVGSMAWTRVGAQGRYAYSTAVGFVGSWCVTVPLAAIFSIQMKYDLQGQTAAVVIGYMVSGTWNTFTLLRSDWRQISDNVIAYNTAHDIELECSDGEEEDEEENNSVNVDAMLIMYSETPGRCLFPSHGACCASWSANETKKFIKYIYNFVCQWS
jgi:MatE